MSSPKCGYVEVEGASLYYELTGTGPALILVHGFSLDLTMWDDQVVPFSNQYTVLRYDLRGFGKSSSSEVPYSHAGDLKALLDQLGIKEAYFVGLSMGGGAVINFTLTYPEISRGLIVVAPSLGGFKWSTESIAFQTSMQTIVRERGLEAMREIWLRQSFFRQSRQNPRVSAKLKEMVNRYTGWHWMNSDLGRPLTPPAIERLGEIHVPTLIAIGEMDGQDQQRIAETLLSGIPGSSQISFPVGGHMLNMEFPDQFNQHVLEFLDRIRLNGHN